MPSTLPPASVSNGFATPAELAALREVAAGATWRVLLNQYHYCKLQVGTNRALTSLEARAHALIGGRPGDTLDSFLLDYGNGHSVPEHMDSDNIQRLNLIVVASRDGGGLRIAGELVQLREGDAVVFDPSTTRHSVDPVVERRLIWSYGIARRATRKTFIPIEEN